MGLVEWTEIATCLVKTKRGFEVVAGTQRCFCLVDVTTVCCRPGASGSYVLQDLPMNSALEDRACREIRYGLIPVPSSP